MLYCINLQLQYSRYEDVVVVIVCFEFFVLIVQLVIFIKVMGRADAVYKARTQFQTANDISIYSRSPIPEVGKLLAGVCILNNKFCVFILVV